jgi:hypothetical protein
MTSALKLGGEEGVRYHLCKTRAGNERTHTKHVCVVVQTGELCAVYVGAECRTDTLMLRGAYPTAP